MMMLPVPRVRLVVLREEHPAGVAAQLGADDVLHPHLLLDPQRHRLHEGGYPGGGAGEICLEDALELQERLFVERDDIDVGEAG